MVVPGEGPLQVTWRTPESDKDESIGMGVDVVARVGWYDRGSGEELQGMSGSTAITGNSTDTAIELAYPSMVAASY